MARSKVFLRKKGAFGVSMAGLAGRAEDSERRSVGKKARHAHGMKKNVCEWVFLERLQILGERQERRKSYGLFVIREEDAGSIGKVKSRAGARRSREGLRAGLPLRLDLILLLTEIQNEIQLGVGGKEFGSAAPPDGTPDSGRNPITPENLCFGVSGRAKGSVACLPAFHSYLPDD